MYRFAAVPTGPWLSAVYHARAGKRYYGLMRRSDELRPAWASSAYSVRSLPWRAVRLTFPSLAVVYDRACPSRGLPQPESAITTRPNHPLPRQDLHLQVCQRLKAAHKNLLFASPLVLSAARVRRPLIWRRSAPRPRARRAVPPSAEADADTVGEAHLAGQAGLPGNRRQICVHRRSSVVKLLFSG